MRKPIKPLPADCCGSGCTRCVYDIYRDHKAMYKKWKKEQEEEQKMKKQQSDGN